MDELILHPDVTDILFIEEEEPIESKQRNTNGNAQETTEQREGKRENGNKASVWDRLGKKIDDERTAHFKQTDDDDGNRRKRKISNSYRLFNKEDQGFNPPQQKKRKENNHRFPSNDWLTTDRKVIEIAYSTNKHEEEVSHHLRMNKEKQFMTDRKSTWWFDLRDIEKCMVIVCGLQSKEKDMANL